MASPSAAAPALTPAPRFIEQLPVARRAWAFAQEAHRGQTRKFDGEPFMLHPHEVAALLHDAGCADRVVAAGLLHDTVERTDASIADLYRRFGREVAALVAAVTEDERITSYRERKDALRRKATGSGRDAAVVFAADKVSKVRQYRAQLALAGGSGHPPHPRRLQHYTESLRLLEQVIPRHPLVDQLRTELRSLGALSAAA